MNFTEKEGVRRHKKLRENMAEANIDVLVVYGNNGRMGIYSGNLAYVSNFISFSGQQALVFPLEGDPVLFVGVENQRIEAIRKSWIKDTRCEAMTSVTMQVCDYLNEIGVEGKRVGVSSFSIMPVSWYEQFQQNLSPQEWVDASEMVWKERLIQSDEEIVMSKHSAKLGDAAWNRIRECAAEGISELEIRAEMDAVMLPGAGTENFNMMGLGSMANGGEAPWGYVIPQTDRKMEKGDAVLLEISPRVNGYWNQLVRVLCLGQPESWLTEAYDLVRRARDATLEVLGPDKPMIGLVDAMNKVFADSGREVWPYGLVHLTGLDLTDYMITPKSTGTLKPNQIVTVHPMYQLSPNRQIFWGESYVITEDGFEPINISSDELEVK